MSRLTSDSHRMILMAVQRLRGRPVGAYIRKLQEWERLEPKAFQRLRAERLAHTLEYAKTRVPLYGSGLWRDASSGDIVLTCTTNRVMPLIRYRVGDRGRLSPEPCRCGRARPVIAGIEGRVGDVLLTATGGRVHGTALGDLLKGVIANRPTAIGQVLFEQHDLRTWTVLVQPGPDFGDGVAALLTDGVRASSGRSAGLQ